MRMIFKVSYYVRSNYENKQGKSPLMIRIFLNGEMLNVGSSGIYIDKKLWNNSTNRVKAWKRILESECSAGQHLKFAADDFQEA